MHRVDAQVARLAAGFGLAPLADHDRRGPRLGGAQQTLLVTAALAQVEVAVGEARQPCILGATIDQMLALENTPCGRAAQRFVGFVDRRQQFDVRPRVALGETSPLVDRSRDPSAGRVESDQPRDLSPAQPGHLLDVAPYKATRCLVQLLILLLDQHLFYPAIELAAILALKSDSIAGRNKLDH